MISGCLDTFCVQGKGFILRGFGLISRKNDYT